MQIRRPRADELAEVGAITVRAYADFTLGPDDPYLARLAGADARDREAEVWVAVADDADDERLLGSVTRAPDGSPWREIARSGEGEFRMLSVDPAARGLGVGEALVRHVVGLSREAGDHAVVLSSLAAMSAAHHIYDRLGFTRLPERDWDPVPGVHLLAFRLEL